jgi:MFS family permease
MSAGGPGGQAVARKQNQRRPAGWRLPWAVSPLLVAVTVLGRSSQNVSQTTYPLVGHELLAMTNAVIGVVAATGGVVGIVVSAFVVGRVPVRARLWVLAGGQALGAVGFVLFALSGSQGMLWAGAVVLGASGGAVFPLLMTVIGQGRRSERAKALAVFALALSASLVVGPLVEAGVLHLLGDSLRAAFAALLPLPLAATVLTLVEASRQRPGRARGERRPPADPELAEAASALPGETMPELFERPSSPASPASPGAEDVARTRRAFRVALLALLTYQAPFTALLTFGALLGRHDDRASAPALELAFGVFFAMSLCVRALITLQAPLRRVGRVLVGSLAATVLGVAVFASVHGLAGFFAGMAILGVPHGATLPTASSVLAENTPSRLLGRANGRLMAGTNGLTVLVPFACGWLAQVVGYRSTFLLLEVPVGLFGALLLIELSRRGTSAAGLFDRRPG